MKKIILMVGGGLLAFLILIGAIVGTVVIVVRQMAPAMTAAPRAAAQEEPEVIVTKDNKVALKPFVTNLADTGSRTYISVSFELILRNAGDKPKIEDNLPLIRDTVISALNSLKAQEVSSDPGYNSLKNQLQTKLNGVLGGKMIQMVLVTDLVVQY